MASQPDPASSLRRAYHDRLQQLDDELVASASVLVDALARASRTLFNVDHGAVASVRLVTQDVQERCREVEAQGFLLLAREAPVAGDLRRLVSLLRLVTSVDRTAALTRHVAEGADQAEIPSLPVTVVDVVQELANRTSDVFCAGLDAWRQRDGLAVHDVEKLDEGVDRLRNHMLSMAPSEVETPVELLLLGLLGRYFERIADHGVDFARHATFATTGERLPLRVQRT